MLIAALVAGLALAPASTTPASAAGAWQGAVGSQSREALVPTECAKVLFVGVRGSDEHDVNGTGQTFGRTVQHVRDALKADLDGYGSTATVRQVYLQYTADRAEDAYQNPSRFAASVLEGTSRLKSFLSGASRTCPQEKWVLSGYSQGAMVVDRVVAGLGSADLGRIDGVFTAADPYSEIDRPFVQAGSATHATGIAVATKGVPAPVYRLKALIGPSPRLSYAIAGNAISYCSAPDPVCNFSYRAAVIRGVLNGSGFAYHGGAYFGDPKIATALAPIASLIFGTVGAPAPAPPSVQPPSPQSGAVTISDAVLKRCLIDAVKAQTGVDTTAPTAAQIASLTSLSCTSGPWNLSPLVYATGLRSLSLEFPGTPDLTPISDLTGLQSLDLYPVGNDVQWLSRLTDLRTLSLGGYVDDVTPIGRLTKLQNLQISSGHITDPSPLAALPDLQNLNLNQNLISDVSSLRPLYGIASFHANGTLIQSTSSYGWNVKVGDTTTFPAVVGRNGALTPTWYDIGSGDGGVLQGNSVTWTKPGRFDLQFKDPTLDFSATAFVTVTN